MDDQRTIITDLELAIADAEWRHELEQALGHAADEDELTPVVLKGAAETPLRRAFEARQQAFHQWRAARGLRS